MCEPVNILIFITFRMDKINKVKFKIKCNSKCKVKLVFEAYQPFSPGYHFAKNINAKSSKLLTTYCFIIINNYAIFGPAIKLYIIIT